MPSCRAALEAEAWRTQPPQAGPGAAHPPADSCYSHPGLALDRWVREVGDKEHVADRYLIAAAANSLAPAVYRGAYGRWKQTLEAQADTVMFTGVLQSPLALGLGEPSSREVGLTLHHTYGVPVIPGSALKGLARRVAYHLVASDELTLAQFTVLFGQTPEDLFGARAIGVFKKRLPDGARKADYPESAGYVTFHDAWLIPKKNIPPLKPDTITVHHSKYYQKQGEEWPTDFDDPIPVPFVAVRPQSEFLFALQGPAEWTSYVAKLIRYGLETDGIGGKTSAGYGRMRRWRQLDQSPIVDVAPGGASREGIVELVSFRDGQHPNCRLRERLRQGRVQLTITRDGFFPLEVAQSVWQGPRSSLSESQKRAAKDGKLEATVTLTFAGQQLRTISLDEVRVSEGK